MELFNYLRTEWNIDGIIMLIVIGAGFFQDAYLRWWKLSEDNKTSGALKTLLVSLVVAVVYVLLLSANGKFPREVWATYLISYFAATSFYELILRPFRKLLEGKSKEPTQKENNI